MSLFLGPLILLSETGRAESAVINMEATESEMVGVDCLERSVHPQMAGSQPLYS